MHRVVAMVRLEVLDPAAMHVSATHFTTQDCTLAGHETDLRPRRGLVVHADVVHRGLGTGSCGPDVLDRYRITTGDVPLLVSPERRAYLSVRLVTEGSD